MGNCIHVWHYAQALARLFQSLAKRMREQSYSYQDNFGGIPFRHAASKAAFDGQCGEILSSYREYLTSSDKDWLKNNWQPIRKSINYIIDRWDNDEDGIPLGNKHNTLDAELTGSNP